MKESKKDSNTLESEELVKIIKNISPKDSFTFQNNMFELNVTPTPKDMFLTRVSVSNKKIIKNKTDYYVYNLASTNEDFNIKNNETIASKPWLKKFGDKMSDNYAVLSEKEVVDVLLTFNKLARTQAFE